MKDLTPVEWATLLLMTIAIILQIAEIVVQIILSK